MKPTADTTEKEEKGDYVTIAFRCPQTLVSKLILASQQMDVSRKDIIQEALRIFIKEVHKRKGFIIPPYPPSGTALPPQEDTEDPPAP